MRKIILRKVIVIGSANAKANENRMRMMYVIDVGSTENLRRFPSSYLYTQLFMMEILRE